MGLVFLRRRRDQGGVPVAVALVHVSPDLGDHLDDLVVPSLRRIHQRSAAGLFVLQVGVGASSEKDFDHLLVALEGSLYQRSVPFLVLHVQVCPRLEQLPHDSRMPLCGHQRRPPRRVLHICVDAGLEHQLDYSMVALSGRVHERRHAAVILQVYVAATQKYRHHRFVAAHPHQRGSTRRIWRVRVGAGREQSLDQFDPALAYRPHDHRGRGVVEREVGVGACREHGLDYVHMAAVHRLYERSIFQLARFSIRAGRKRLNHRQSAARRGEDQRREAVVVLCVHRSPRLYKGLDDRLVALPCRVHQRRRSVLRLQVQVGAGSNKRLDHI
mmetsp:Transcript_14140/g.37167  ORF Transcript_14140/g.37167 Transcript_14140/m.37167 type:complete len:328 (-) Transcript_14140:45-1028(-)